jgi:lysozyme family protein
MDDRFLQALETTLKHEGGYNDVQGDAGGATNFGISLRYLKDLFKTDDWVDVNGDGVVDAKDIKNLTKEDAAKIYYKQFWQRQHCDLITHKNVAAKLFDMSVNMGLKQAAKLIQRAVNRLGFVKLVDDGILGQASIVAINKADEKQLEVLLRYECIMFYQGLIQAKPDYVKFLKGWTMRAVS